MNKIAYELGQKIASDLLKMAMDPGTASIWGSLLPVPFAPQIAAGMAAPEGKGWGAAGGSLLGGAAGAAAGGGLGLGLGALASILSKGKIKPGLIGGLAGAGLGGLTGQYYGAQRGAGIK